MIDERQQLAALRQRITSKVRLDVDLHQARADYDAFGGGGKVEADVQLTSDTLGGVEVEWSTTPGASQDHVVLFLHGGGYAIGSIISHRPLATEIGRRAGTSVASLNYRLAPEHPFPSPIDDAVAAYKALLKTFDPAKIAFSGDSAGGNLALGTMIAARDAGLPLPGAAFCMSPWVDMEARGETIELKSVVDPLVDRANVEGAIAIYLAGTDPRDPRAGLLYADLSGLPPLLIQAGTHEALLDDAIRIARRAAIADVDVTLRCWPEMVHDWQMFWPDLQAGHRAIKEGGAFIAKHLRLTE